MRRIIIVWVLLFGVLLCGCAKQTEETSQQSDETGQKVIENDQDEKDTKPFWSNLSKQSSASLSVEGVPNGVLNLLQTLADSIRQGDPEILDTLTSEFGDEEEVRPYFERLIQNGRETKLSKLELFVSEEGSLDESRPEIEYKRATITIRWSYDGVPREFSETFKASFLESNGQWGMMAVIDWPDETTWLNNELRSVGSKNFVILSPPEHYDMAQDALLPALEEAYTDMAKRLKRKAPPPGPRYLVYIEEVSGDARVYGDWEYNSAGKTTNSILCMRIDPQIASYSADTVSKILHHECVHLFLSPEMPPWTPAWVQEGLAEYFAGPLNKERLRQAVENDFRGWEITELTTKSEITELEMNLQEKIAYGYALSEAAIHYLVEKHGEAKVMEFMKAYNALSPDDVAEAAESAYSMTLGGESEFRETNIQVTSDSLKRVFNLTERKLDQEVKQWAAEKVQ